MQQFEDTIKQCKKHQEELQIAHDTMKQKEQILEQEKFLCKWYEDQTHEKFAENQILFKATNILSNEKKILLAKLENQFNINVNNETVIQDAISKTLSFAETFHTEIEDKLTVQKTLQTQCMDDCINQKSDLEKYSKQFKDLQMTTNRIDLLKNIAVRKTLDSYMGGEQKIIQEKLVSLHNCIQQIKIFQETNLDMAYKYKDKAEKVRI